MTNIMSDVNNNLCKLKDVVGKPLSVGDTVVTTFGSVSTLRPVKVISFSRTKIWVERNIGGETQTFSKFPTQVALIESFL